MMIQRSHLVQKFHTLLKILNMNALKNIFTVLIFVLMTSVNAQQKDQCRYIKTPTGYLMVLRQGDDVLAHIENMAKTETFLRPVSRESVLLRK